MTYNEFIQNIIDTRGQWNIPEGEYFEIHHILPECMGGEGKIYKGKGKRETKHPNLIWLYAREHFIAHKLLAEENPDNDKLFYAWYMMAFCKSGNQKRYQITAEEYEELQVKKSKYMSNLFSNIPRDDNWCSNISKSLTGVKRGHWYNNGEKSILAFECPEGFVLGRLQKDINKIHNKRRLNDNYRKDDNYRKKLSNSIKALNFHWYNDGVNNYQIRDGDPVPEGFLEGSIHRGWTEEERVAIGERNVGKKWFNNGKINIFRNPGEPLPEGFVPGMISRKTQYGK